MRLLKFARDGLERPPKVDVHSSIDFGLKSLFRTLPRNGLFFFHFEHQDSPLVFHLTAYHSYSMQFSICLLHLAFLVCSSVSSSEPARLVLLLRPILIRRRFEDPPLRQKAEKAKKDMGTLLAGIVLPLSHGAWAKENVKVLTLALFLNTTVQLAVISPFTYPSYLLLHEKHFQDLLRLRYSNPTIDSSPRIPGLLYYLRPPALPLYPTRHTLRFISFVHGDYITLASPII